MNSILHHSSTLKCRRLLIVILKEDNMLKLNTLRLRKNGHHFADDIFKLIFLYEKGFNLIQMSLKFSPDSPNTCNNKPSLVQIMAWHQKGARPLSEPMMAWFTDMAWPGWVKVNIMTACDLVTQSRGISRHGVDIIYSEFHAPHQNTCFEIGMLPALFSI